MKVALYARVSSEKQAENDLSISAQLKALRNYVVKNGWGIYKEFIDEAESALSANRPAFQEMIAMAKKRNPPFEAILIWKFSRFARNREDSIIYKSLLRKHGVSVISMNEQVDDSPAGRLLEGIIEVIDEFYSLNLAEDTIRGLRENANRGFQNGNIPIGYKAKKVMDGNNERTKLEPDEIIAPIVKRIFTLYTQGNGIKEIAKSLNKEGLKTNKGKTWSKSTISYILNNEVYTGTLIYGKKSKNRIRVSDSENIIRIENNHTPIIKKDIFDTVRKILAERRLKVIHPREINSEYLLSSLLYCGKCGAKMIGCSAKSGKFFYYGCHNYSKRGKDICDMKFVNKDEIEGLVIERIKTHVVTEENLTQLYHIVLNEIDQNTKDSEEEIKIIDKQLEGLRKKLGKLYNALETGKLDIDDLAPRIKELKAQVNTLEEKRNETSEEIRNPKMLPFSLKTIKGYVEDLADLLCKGTIIERKSFLRSFIKRIVVNHPEITIDYNIPIINKKGRTSEEEVLPLVKNGSPNWTVERTFTITVYLPEITKPIKQKVIKSYRNPIVMAKEFKNFIDTNFAKSEADLARKLNISRVRVNQIMNLLKLDREVIKTIEDIGDPMPRQIISERRLRPLVKMTSDKQIVIIKAISNQH